jgi:hypothetical protein
VEFAKVRQKGTTQLDALKQVPGTETLLFACPATEVVAAQPASPTKLELFGQLAGNWARHDPEGAVAWARKLNDAKSREAALKTRVGPWADNDARGCGGIRARKNAADQWLKVDEATARTAVGKSPLPADLKHKLLKPGG